jgi:hypothetical protein
MMRLGVCIVSFLNADALGLANRSAGLLNHNWSGFRDAADVQKNIIPMVQDTLSV